MEKVKVGFGNDPNGSSSSDPSSSSDESRSSAASTISDLGFPYGRRKDAERFIHRPETIFSELELPARDILWSRLQRHPKQSLLSQEQLSINRAKMGPELVGLATAPHLIHQYWRTETTFSDRRQARQTIQPRIDVPAKLHGTIPSLRGFTSSVYELVYKMVSPFYTGRIT